MARIIKNEKFEKNKGYLGNARPKIAMRPFYGEANDTSSLCPESALGAPENINMIVTSQPPQEHHRGVNA